MLACEVWFSFSLSPSAGCGPPSPPVNGSVGGWTSSRVGSQVTYSCNTDLVLVGERVAYCSLPQLQWLPSSDDVVCVQPPPSMHILDGLGKDVCIRWPWGRCIYVLLYIPTATVPVTTLPQTPLPPSKCSGCLLIL